MNFSKSLSPFVSAIMNEGRVTSQIRYLSRGASLCRRTFIMRKDRTEQHNEVIEIDKTDKHRYYRWNYKPLPTQTALDKPNALFSIRSSEFKLPNARGRLAKKVWRERMLQLQHARQDVNLEKLARTRQLIIPLDEVEEEWRSEFGLFDVTNTARFYGITKDLYQSDDVVLSTWLNVAFDDVTIHRGNLLTAEQLSKKPSITYDLHDKDDNSSYTLIVSNLDGHPTADSTNKEIIHWKVCNISNNHIDGGDTILDYLPLVPWKGTGYHRLVFSLYKQQERIQNTSSATNTRSIGSRTISSHEFTKQHNMVPVGLAWCQMTWDESVTETCKIYSDLRGEPIFDWEEYLEPKLKNRKLKTLLGELKYRNM